MEFLKEEIAGSHKGKSSNCYELNEESLLNESKASLFIEKTEKLFSRPLKNYLRCRIKNVSQRL
ncbi:hypothetical protein [Nitrosomonas sp.]|uniref:hypothetical protein n=1 Tax=Nitrosomonas sp. TaxID=42353 RepID=UPI002604FAED|nr:hypothetical protein [Nitrosomonas sp.]